jgi:hypothetical protein
MIYEPKDYAIIEDLIEKNINANMLIRQNHGYIFEVRNISIGDDNVLKVNDNNFSINLETYSFDVRLIDKRDEPNIDHEYTVTKFIPNVINLFENGGYSRTSSGEKKGGVFLFGYKDKLYKVESDYQVGESMHNFDACGSGEDFALGSLYTTEGLGLTPEERIYTALKTASTFAVGVEAPFYIINTENDKVVEFHS